MSVLIILEFFLSLGYIILLYRVFHIFYKYKNNLKFKISINVVKVVFHPVHHFKTLLTTIILLKRNAGINDVTGAVQS